MPYLMSPYLSPDPKCIKVINKVLHLCMQMFLHLIQIMYCALYYLPVPFAPANVVFVTLPYCFSNKLRQSKIRANTGACRVVHHTPPLPHPMLCRISPAPWRKNGFRKCSRQSSLVHPLEKRLAHLMRHWCCEKDSGTMSSKDGRLGWIAWRDMSVFAARGTPGSESRHMTWRKAGMIPKVVGLWETGSVGFTGQGAMALPK